jgi:hypothetical protein
MSGRDIVLIQLAYLAAIVLSYSGLSSVGFLLSILNLPQSSHGTHSLILFCH